MRKPFEEWAQQEITRLRTEADALERALRKYLESEKKSGLAIASSEDAESISVPRSAYPRERVGSKSSKLLGYIKDGGSQGVSRQDIYKFAENQQLGMDPNSIRSVLWYAKKQGRVIERGGRYYPQE
jgi:hypothetical protein